jgi:uncharacterized SAM-binding protein YcdF (DUF218 family)
MFRRFRGSLILGTIVPARFEPYVTIFPENRLLLAVLHQTMNLEHEQPIRRSLAKPFAWITLCIVAIPLISTFLISGRSSAEKMMTLMVQPLFVALFSVLLVGGYLARSKERVAGYFLLVGGCLLWCISTPVFSSYLIRRWESSVTSSEPSVVEPFETLIVFGGGTSSAPNGRAQFSGAGDRVGYAARLFLTGKVKHLVTTGDPVTITGALGSTDGFQNDPSEHTKAIWADLGIPPEAVSELQGQNTYSEIASLKKHPEWWQGKRCGLMTSAFHMPRTMTLAKQAGLTVEPVTADYQSGQGPLLVNSFMPDCSDLFRVQQITKEWIAMLIRR